MTASVFEPRTWSGATGSELGIRVTFPASGATVFLPEADTVYARPTSAGRPWRVPVRSIIIATVLPFAAVDEVVFRRRYEADSVSTHVLYLGEEALGAFESPSVLAVWPQRRTFHFRSGRPARRLPQRLPFIPTTSVVPNEE